MAGFLGFFWKGWDQLSKTPQKTPPSQKLADQNLLTVDNLANILPLTGAKYT